MATLSALPWMVVEFKKADYSVHYQGAPLASVPAGSRRVHGHLQPLTCAMTVDACSPAISPSPAAAAWFIAGIFVILAVSASIYEVRRVQWVAGTAAATAVAICCRLAGQVSLVTLFALHCSLCYG